MKATPERGPGTPLQKEPRNVPSALAAATPERGEGRFSYPTAVGLMSGPNSPLEVALAWCGWKVKTYELLGTPFDEPMDLNDPEVRAEAELDVEVCDLLTFQMDCSTFTRARDIPVKGKGAGRLLPMRSEAHVRGVPALKGQYRKSDRERVKTMNSIADWGLELLNKVLDRGDGALVENPQNSYFWLLEGAQTMLEKGCVDYEHAACAFMGARAKKQRWRGNIEQVRQRRAECRHVHSKDEWQWKRDASGHAKPQTKEEAEYTAHHAFYMAVELSVWAVETGRAALSLPRFRLLPSEGGSRVGWTEYPPEAFRS